MRASARSIGDISNHSAIQRPAQAEPAADTQIGELLKQVQQQSDVPAIAAAIVTSEGLVAFGVAGVRKRGTKSPAMPNDLWHLGSNTKAMTATLVAQLVEQDQLKWDTTLADVFPDSSFKIHPDLRGVTVLQLLSHRSGLPANLNLADYLGVNGRRERLRAVRQELAKPPREHARQRRTNIRISGTSLPERSSRR